MDLKGIVNIAGKPGLYKVLTSSKNSFIVESLDTDKKRLPVPAHNKVAALEEISIYTEDGQVALKDVFVSLKGADFTMPNLKNDQEVRGIFDTILPDYDADRFYVSDMRKVLKWYEILDPIMDLSINSSESDKSEETDQADQAEQEEA